MTTTITCTECGSELPGPVVLCPRCGGEQDVEARKSPVAAPAPGVAASAAAVGAEASPPLCADPSCRQPLTAGASLCLYCGAEVAAQRVATVLLLPNGDRLSLKNGEYVVLGRDPAASPCAHAFAGYDNVSGRHAEVRATAEGFSVTDLQSTNGTRIEDSLLSRGGTVHVSNSGALRLGADAVVHVLVGGLA